MAKRRCSTRGCGGEVTGDLRRIYCDECRPPKLRSKWRRQKAVQRGSFPKVRAAAKTSKKVGKKSKTKTGRR